MAEIGDPKYVVIKKDADFVSTTDWPDGRTQVAVYQMIDAERGCFVMKGEVDPAALLSLMVYACMCAPELSDQIIEFLATIPEFERIGDQGARNTMPVMAFIRKWGHEHAKMFEEAVRDYKERHPGSGSPERALKLLEKISKE